MSASRISQRRVVPCRIRARTGACIRTGTCRGDTLRGRAGPGGAFAGTFAAAWNAAGRLVADPAAIGADALRPAAAATADGSQVVIHLPSGGEAVVVSFLARGGAVVQVGPDLVPVRDVERQVTLLLVLAGSIGLVLTLVAGWVLASCRASRVSRRRAPGRAGARAGWSPPAPRRWPGLRRQPPRTPPGEKTACSSVQTQLSGSRARGGPTLAACAGPPASSARPSSAARRPDRRSKSVARPAEMSRSPRASRMPAASRSQSDALAAGMTSYG
jgi:hypothetical protein